MLKTTNPRYTAKTKGRTMAREFPPHVSVLLNRLCENAALFLQHNGENDQRMRGILHELKELSDEVQELHDKTCKTNVIGATAGTLGAGAGLCTALGLGAAASREVAGKLPTVAAGGVTMLAACAMAIVGVATMCNANSRKAVTEEEMMRSVKQLDTAFLIIVEPQKEILEEIKKVSDELEEKSSSLRTTAGAQAQTALLEIEEYQRLLRRMSELTEKPNVKMFISESASQCERTVEELARLKSKLRDFEEN